MMSENLLTVKEVAQKGMNEMSEKFRKNGGEIYHKTDAAE